MTPPLLVLWDIDHTLIETRGVGTQVYAEAFVKVTGRPLEKMPELAGRTEPVIFREALKVNGINANEALYPQFASEQARAYAAHLDELRTLGRALPGAAEALQALSERNDVLQSVLTGNTRPSSEIKLRAFDLDRYLDFDIGAYGTDNDTRANLVDIPIRQQSRVLVFHNRDSISRRQRRPANGDRRRASPYWTGGMESAQIRHPHRAISVPLTPVITRTTRGLG